MLAQLRDYLFHPLLKLAAVRRTGYHRSDIQSHDPFAFQRPALVADDAQRQALNDSGLADTRLTYEDWVVLLPAAQDLYHALNLSLASYDGV